MSARFEHPVGRHWSVRFCLGLVLLGGLTGCGSTSSRNSSGLVFPASVAQAGMGGFGRGLDAVDGSAINPFDPVALNNQAVAEAARGRYQLASSLLQRAVKLAPARADIAANLLSLQRWMAQAEGQSALGMDPQPLQLPLPETALPDVPPLWMPPPAPLSPAVAAGSPGGVAPGANQSPQKAGAAGGASASGGSLARPVVPAGKPAGVSGMPGRAAEAAPGLAVVPSFPQSTAPQGSPAR